ncbi:MAG: YmdB family metallophosphoesterase [Firmicutes bacterium]|nr:YmdB family metallophosphoesterase [Bacillota bacterium]
MKILAVGDIFGEAAAGALGGRIRAVCKAAGATPELTVVNGENAAEGRGLTPETAREIFSAGADIITTGNHIWDKRVIYDYLDSEPRILRPANYPAESPGVGYNVVSVSSYRVLIMNLLGCAFISPTPACPYETAERIFGRERGRYDFALIDFHAEATGEKLAFARYIDSHREYRVAAIWGTHTHIQTADEKILPFGTGYITDIGMTGPEGGVIGVKPENIISVMKNKMPAKFEVADGNIALHGALFEIDPERAVTTGVCRVSS